MALKIRLRQQGRTNRATYRLVVTENRSPRDGKYVEMLGWYNPFEAELDKSLSIKADRIQHWLDQGAQLTDKAKTLVAKLAPKVVSGSTEREVANRAKALAKKKARKQAAAAKK
jgi:small subunit ribosomal protein S16